MINKPDVTSIIPTYNEEEGIADVITSLKEVSEDYEILAVDGDSTDNTYKLATETGVKVIRHPYNKGYGAALKAGIRNAEADVVLFMDAGKCIEKLYFYISKFRIITGDHEKWQKQKLQ